MSEERVRELYEKVEAGKEFELSEGAESIWVKEGGVTKRYGPSWKMTLGADPLMTTISGKPSYDLVSYEDPFKKMTVFPGPEERFGYSLTGQTLGMVEAYHEPELPPQRGYKWITTPEGRRAYVEDVSTVTKAEPPTIRQRAIERIQRFEAERGGPQSLRLWREGGLPERAREIETFVQTRVEKLPWTEERIITPFGYVPSKKDIVGISAFGTGLVTGTIERPQSLALTIPSFGIGAGVGYFGTIFPAVKTGATVTGIGLGAAYIFGYPSIPQRAWMPGKAQQVMAAPTPFEKGLVIGKGVSTEVGPTFVGGYAGYKAGARLATIADVRVSGVKLDVRETVAPKEGIPGKFEFEGIGKAKVRYPYRIFKRVGPTRDVALAGRGKIIGREVRTYSIQEFRAYELPVGKDLKITTGEMIGYTEPISKKPDLFYGKSYTLVKGKEPQLILGKSIIKQMGEPWKVAGAEFTEYRSVGISKDILPATKVKGLDFGRIIYERPVTTEFAEPLKWIAPGKPSLKTAPPIVNVGGIITTVVKPTVPPVKPAFVAPSLAPATFAKTFLPKSEWEGTGLYEQMPFGVSPITGMGVAQITPTREKITSSYKVGVTPTQVSKLRQQLKLREKEETKQRIRQRQRLRQISKLKTTIKIAPKIKIRQQLRIRQRQRQRQRQRLRLRLRMAMPTVPPPPVTPFPFMGLPFTKYPGARRKRRLSYQPSRRKARYKPSIVGITRPAVKFKPAKMFTGLGIRRVRK